MEIPEEVILYPIHDNVKLGLIPHSETVEAVLVFLENEEREKVEDIVRMPLGVSGDVLFISQEGGSAVIWQALESVLSLNILTRLKEIEGIEDVEGLILLEDYLSAVQVVAEQHVSKVVH